MTGIEFNDVSFVWNAGASDAVTVLCNLSYRVERGQFVSLLGPSGAGKSTMLDLIAGLKTPLSGSVLWNAERIVGPSPDRGLVTQKPKLFPWASVIENAEWGLRMRGVSRVRRREAAMEMLRNVGLVHWSDRRVYELSGGMRQRLAVARVLANDSSLLMMDEPFVGLDIQTRVLMQRFVQAIWQESAKTVVLVTHSTEEALMADRVIVFSRRPARILEDIVVALPRPRDIQDASFNRLNSHLTRLVEREVMEGAIEEGTWSAAAEAPAVWKTNGDESTGQSGRSQDAAGQQASGF